MEFNGYCSVWLPLPILRVPSGELATVQGLSVSLEGQH